MGQHATKWLVNIIVGKSKFSMIFTDLSSSAYFLLITTIDIKVFQGPYARSTMEPDAGFRLKLYPDDRLRGGLLAVVPRLLEDMELWLVGSNPTVSMVILAKFLRRGAARVACKVEVYQRDPITQPHLRCSERSMYVTIYHVRLSPCSRLA